MLCVLVPKCSPNITVYIVNYRTYIFKEWFNMEY